MKEFTLAYQKNFHEASTQMLVKIMEKYTQHGWMVADTYNSLIVAFGKQFESFSFKELASFCKSIGKAGLRQADILTETINRIQTVAGKFEAEGGEIQDTYYANFNRVFIPIFESIVDLDLANNKAEGSDQTLLQKAINDEFHKKAIAGNSTFIENALKENVDHQHLLALILKGGLYNDEPVVKELANKLIEKINSQDSLDIGNDTMTIYQNLTFGNTGLTTPLAPKNLQSIKNSFEKSLKNTRKMSQLYLNSKLQPAL